MLQVPHTTSSGKLREKRAKKWICVRTSHSFFRKTIFDTQEAYGTYKAQPDTHGPFSTRDILKCEVCETPREDVFMQDLPRKFPGLPREAFWPMWAFWEKTRESLESARLEEEMKEKTIREMAEKSERKWSYDEAKKVFEDKIGKVMEKMKLYATRSDGERKETGE